MCFRAWGTDMLRRRIIPAEDLAWSTKRVNGSCSCSRHSRPISLTNSGRCSAKKETCSKLHGQNTTLRSRRKKNSKSRCRSTASCAAASLCLPTRREDFVVERALADEKVQSAIAGKQIVKKIYVPGKLVNIVVK